MLQNLPYRAKSAYAAAAHGVGKGLVAMHLMSPEAPSRTHRLRHWGHSLVVVYDSAALSSLDVPWWTYDAIDVVEGWLKARAEASTGRCACSSTARAPARCGSPAGSVRSIRWSTTRVSPTPCGRCSTSTTTSTSWCGRPCTSTSPKVPSHKPSHTGHGLRRLRRTIDEVGGEFDLIVIDGRAREACLTAAIPHLADGGLIVYDNTHRKRYKRAIAASGLVESVYTGLTPTLPYPDRTSLLRRAGTPSPDTA